MWTGFVLKYILEIEKGWHDFPSFQFLDIDGGFDKGKEGWKQQFLNEITKCSEAKFW